MTEGSFVSWIDFGTEDQKRARDYLRLLGGEGTVDELGFGIMRDAFADVFFPAVNTIMSHSRHYIFISAIYLYLESLNLHGLRVARRCEEMEKQLRRVLAKNGEISIVKEELKRYPSTVYWGALRLLGIFVQPDWSQAYYHDQLKNYFACLRGMKDDDGEIHIVGDNIHHWDSKFAELYYHGDCIKLDENGEFPEDTGLALTYDEASYITLKFQQLADRIGRPSLMSHLLNNKVAKEFNYPWDIECPPESLKKYIHHAERLSILAKGATLIYYQMLIEKKRDRGMVTVDHEFSDPFSLWWACGREAVCSWDMDDYFQIASGMKAVRGKDREFFRGWQRLLSDNRNASEFLSSEEVRRRIREREREKRPAKSRLRHPKYLKQWRFSGGIDSKAYTDTEMVKFSLDFRSDIAGRLVSEIVRGLNTGSER